MRRTIPALLLLILLAGYGAVHVHRSTAPHRASPSEGAVPPLVFYTAVGATTPQLPFWAAVRAGWPRGMRLETRFWKDLDDLRGVILAGRGDIWLGHVEGFAQAAVRGAPVTLVAVTGWRKFHFLTADPKVHSMRELSAIIERAGTGLAVTPPDSPAFALLEDMARRGGPGFTLTRHEPRQLALEVMRGDVRHMIAPEPLATVLRMKNPELREVACLEEVYARYNGGPGMLPLAGIAVRTGLLRERPEVVRELVRAMARSAAAWQVTAKKTGRVPEEALDALPPETLRELGRETLRRSLAHDPLRVVPAAEAREDVLAYLAVVLPEAAGKGVSRLPAAFFGELK
jgi:NitT/TauT family transport system substrate-binding protein